MTTDRKPIFYNIVWKALDVSKEGFVEVVEKSVFDEIAMRNDELLKKNAALLEMGASIVEQTKRILEWGK